jgi:hypothetical protein
MFEIQSTQARGGPQPVPFMSSRRAGVVRQDWQSRLTSMSVAQTCRSVGLWALRYRQGSGPGQDRPAAAGPAGGPQLAGELVAGGDELPSGSRYSAATAASTSTASPGILLAAPYQTGCHTRGEAAVTGSRSP